MTIRDNHITMSPKEAWTYGITMLAFIAAISIWIILPHRTTALEEGHKDQESRLRAMEHVRVDLERLKADSDQIKSDVREIKQTLSNRP